ncbi:unnamed protein product [Brassica oleracea var. botrytis]|uniref:Protein kinase domain-containing protein n=1 Tax=Brassica oleracea var. oleracea TaxID=109376 RepID=A0A0D3CXJ8_BRAOL
MSSRLHCFLFCFSGSLPAVSDEPSRRFRSEPQRSVGISNIAASFFFLFPSISSSSFQTWVGDFGLSRLLVYSETTVNSASSSDYVCTGPQGTPGYLDPDYHRSFRLTEKSDVYSYGVVLMELMTRMNAVDQRRKKRDMALAELFVSSSKWVFWIRLLTR